MNITVTNFIDALMTAQTTEQGRAALQALGINDVVNDLTSGGVHAPLSAEQGVVLKGLIDALVVDDVAGLQAALDALQTALNLKLDKAGGDITGDVDVDGAFTHGSQDLTNPESSLNVGDADARYAFDSPLNPNGLRNTWYDVAYQEPQNGELGHAYPWVPHTTADHTVTSSRHFGTGVNAAHSNHWGETHRLRIADSSGSKIIRFRRRLFGGTGVYSDGGRIIHRLLISRVGNVGLFFGSGFRGDSFGGATQGIAVEFPTGQFYTINGSTFDHTNLANSSIATPLGAPNAGSINNASSGYLLEFFLSGPAFRCRVWQVGTGSFGNPKPVLLVADSGSLTWSANFERVPRLAIWNTAADVNSYLDYNASEITKDYSSLAV